MCFPVFIMSALAKNVVWTLSFSNQECYTRDVGVACTNCNVRGRANKKYTNKSVKKISKKSNRCRNGILVGKVNKQGANDE